MTIKEARAIDMVSYLSAAGIEPAKIKGDDYWFYSPFRTERTPSFKVNRRLNKWFDFGEGRGGNLVDFIIWSDQIEIPGVLKKLEALNFSTAPLAKRSHSSTGIEIISIKTMIRPALIRYYQSRRISPTIAEQFLCEVDYCNSGKSYYALGFKNNAGGYELRSQYFKGSSQPKAPTVIRNQSAVLAVLEGMFDLLSYLTICEHQPVASRDFLVFNSLSFFEQQLSFMQSYERVHLYLDNDKAGDKFTTMAKAINPFQFIDERSLYKGYKDLNDWHQHIGLRSPQKE